MSFDKNSYLKCLTYFMSIKKKKIDECLEQQIQNVGRFQNTEYDIVPTPLILDPGKEKENKLKIEKYHNLLEKVIELVLEDKFMINYLEISEEEETLIRTKKRTKRYVEICRLDGYFSEYDEKLKILENNADCPAGIFFTPRLNKVVKNINYLLNSVSFFDSLGKHQFDDPQITIKYFLSQMDKNNGEFVILQEVGKSNIESQEMQKAFSQAGISTTVCSPTEINYYDGTINGKKISLIWNKINSVYWRKLIKNSKISEELFSKLLDTHSIIHLNHFAARYIPENKRFSAMLYEPWFAKNLSEDEKKLILDILPWATVIEPNKIVHWKNEAINIVDFALKNKNKFVIKSPFDIRGDEVTIGLDLSEKEWKLRIEKALKNRLIIQEYIKPIKLPIFSYNKESRSKLANVSIDTFMFGGQVVGYGAKASKKNKVNLFQGGQKLSVFVGEQ